jgi:hypothetical protein
MGWRVSWEQLRVKRKTKFTVDQIKNYQARGIGGLNYVFFKDDSYAEQFARVFGAHTPGEVIDINA